MSASESGFNIFKNLVFVPQWKTDISEIVTLKAEKNDAVLSEIKGFFDGQMYKTFEEDSEGTKKYSNENIIVKFYKTNILEYYNYLDGDISQDQTFASAYGVCMDFLKKDTILKENYVFDKAIIQADGITFCFNYSYNSLPIIFSEETLSENNLNAPIEVVVSDNSVKRYRRLVMDFVPDEQNKQKISSDFLSAVESALENEKETIPFEDIKIAYLSNGSNCELKWFVKSDNKTYISDINQNK